MINCPTLKKPLSRKPSTIVTNTPAENDVPMSSLTVAEHLVLESVRPGTKS